jgi:trans-aconitate 2-methyltransferase
VIALGGAALQNTSHSWNPADYARHSQGQERWARELLTLLAPQPQESVLDIGCGDGRITAEIAGLVADGRAVGIDRSAEMIGFAQEHFPPEQFPNLRFLQADASALPFDGEFDAVFSNAALHWVLDHKPVLAGISRSLRPGGRCVLQMGGKGNGVDVSHIFDACLGEDRLSAIPYGFHGAAEYRIWLRAAGLKPDSVELIEKDMVHSSREAFIGWLRTAWLPYTSRVPEERRDDLLESVTDCYLREHPTDGDGCVHVRMIRLQVLAHKPVAD